MSKRSQKNATLKKQKEISIAHLSVWVGVCAFLVYANALGNGLVYDDHFLIERNDIVLNLDFLRVFTTHYWGGYEGNETGQYRPFTVLSFLFDAFGGINAFRFHLTNVLLHASNSILAFLLCRQVGLTTVGAFVGGMLFAVHPIHAEVAAGVTFGRADLLAGLGLLCTLFFYIEASRKQDVRMYVASLGAFLFGLLSKESALTAIAPVVAYDVYKGTDVWATMRMRWRHWVGFGCVFVFYILMRWMAAGLGFEAGSLSVLNNPMVGHPLDVRLYTAAELFGKYITLVIWPSVLSVDYSFQAIPVSESILDFSVLLGGVTGLLGIGLWFLAFTRRSVLFVAGALFWGPYAAVSQTVILINAMFQERFLYIPVLGIFMLIGVLVEWGWKRHKPLAIVCCCVMFVGYAGRTWSRNQDWRNDFTLYQSAVQAYPNSAKMQHTYADELAQRGQFASAENAYKKALAIREDGLTWNNLGNLYAAQEDFRAAAWAYEQAVEANPLYVEAWMNWGLTAMRAQNVDEAIAAFEKATELAPKNPEAHYNLGIAYNEIGATQKSIWAYEQAILYRPEWAEVQFNLGHAYQNLGDRQMALQAYQQFLKLWRGDPQIAQLAKQAIVSLKNE